MPQIEAVNLDWCNICKLWELAVLVTTDTGPCKGAHLGTKCFTCPGPRFIPVELNPEDPFRVCTLSREKPEPYLQSSVVDS